MFGGNRAKKIDELQREVDFLRAKNMRGAFELAMLQAKWNQLVTRINALGGESFLSGGEYHQRQPARQFDKNELRCLLQLCHPDKHANSELARRMTTKLLELKG